jgi:hypothetical protein
MPVYGRIIMGCLAIFVAWTMLRAMHSGTIFTRGQACEETAHPAMFIVIMIVHGFIVMFCLWLAAGYTPDSFLAQFGLGGLSGKKH